MRTQFSPKPDILADGFKFLEGPRWHEDRLWVSDMFGGAVHTVDMQGRINTVAEVPARPSGLGFMPDGTVLISSMTDRTLLRMSGGTLSVHADLTPHVTGDINDLVVDAQGRAYVGNFGFDLFGDAAFQSATLVMVSPDGAATVVAHDLAFPNGSVIFAETGVLVVAESYGNRLTAFDIAEDGTLRDKRLFADLGDGDPDGICLDQEGAIWVSLVNQNAFARVRDGGEVTHRVSFENRLAVACQLGGPDGCSLFCLTTEGSWEDVAAGRSRSRIDVVTVDVPGAGSP